MPEVRANTANTKSVVLVNIVKMTMKLTIGGVEMEQLSSFVYLSFVFIEDNNCTQDAQRRLTWVDDEFIGYYLEK